MGVQSSALSAEAHLTPDELEDAELVKVVKGLGPPPRLRKRGRFGKAHKQWILEFLHEVPSPTLAARLIGCNRNTIYYHRDKDSAFALAFDRAIDIGKQALEAAAAEEALGLGVRHVVTKEGSVLTIPKERNDKLLMAWLNILNTDRLNRHKHEVEHGGGVILIPKPLPREAWEKMALEQQAPHREPKAPEAGDTLYGPIAIEGLPKEEPKPISRDDIVVFAEEPKRVTKV